MLGYDPFFHDQIRKYEMVFGTLFNEIAVRRTSTDGSTVSLLRVPISFANKDKLLARLEADANIDRPTAAQLPRMSFSLTNIAHNPTNQLRSTGRYSVMVPTDDANTLTEMLNPVPYDFNFTLWVYTKYVEDGNQIIEQILPFFSPSFTATVNMMEGVNVDTQTTIRDCVPEDLYDGNFDKRRMTMWTLHFTMTGYLFGPVRAHPIIKFANANIIVSTNTDIRNDALSLPIDRVTAQPGQDANGVATTNVDLTVAYSQIEPGSDWDYIVTIAGSLVPGDIGGNEGE